MKKAYALVFHVLVLNMMMSGILDLLLSKALDTFHVELFLDKDAQYSQCRPKTSMTTMTTAGATSSTTTSTTLSSTSTTTLTTKSTTTSTTLSSTSTTTLTTTATLAPG
jgi:hypothetical protein